MVGLISLLTRLQQHTDSGFCYHQPFRPASSNVDKSTRPGYHLKGVLCGRSVNEIDRRIQARQTKRVSRSIPVG
jgi:hypothetical protein